MKESNLSSQGIILSAVLKLMPIHLQVKADVTEGSTKLADAIGDDSDAVICATGFRPSWDLLSPWKVNVNLLLLLMQSHFFLVIVIM